MVKAEWGTKRACPKCNARFYDLTKDDPVTCISCGQAWNPEAILKSKQPLPFDAPKPKVVETEDGEAELVDDDLDLDEEEEPSPDDEVDIGGDDDIGVVSGKDDDEV
ncbi:MAG: TIGR02300 family protein [Sphingomonadaceae bacterium]|nr:TIGR02300 family protein [Sphingomonadaceae bacterium]